MIKGIVFDFDGVLVESVNIKGGAFADLYKPDGPEIQQQVLDYHNDHGGMSRYDKIKYYEETLCGRRATEGSIEEKAKKFSEIVERKVIEAPWVSGAKDFLEKNHARLSFYIVSATPQEELKRIVAQRGMSRYFQGVYGTPVKKQDHIMAILDANTWSPEDAVMVGDAMADFNAAQANKVPFIGRVPKNASSPFPEGTTVLQDMASLASVLRLA